MFSVLPRFVLALGLAASLITLAPAVRAGGGPTGAVVIYNPTDPSAVTVANYYQQARGIPERNMIPYVFPANSSFQFASRTVAWDFVYALRAELAARGLNPQLQAIALLGVVPKLSNQSIALFDNGNAFALTSFLYLSPSFGQATFPTSVWTETNRAYADPVAFFAPAPAGTHAMSAARDYNGRSYWPCSHVGYTGKSGLAIREWFAVIDRAIARDGAKPEGTVYWPLNSDVRSSTREFQISTVVPVWKQRGIRYMVTGNRFTGSNSWVQNRTDVVGGVVGQRNPSTPLGIRGGNTMLGGWIDQLTSNGGNIEWFVAQDNQMSCAKWLRAGADGSSGSGFEPYAYQSKFNHAHVQTHFRAGASLAEAFWQSIGNPAEILPMGDPLHQPWASFPVVAISQPADNAVVSGTIAIQATATPTGGQTLEPQLDLFIDGRRIAFGEAAETIAAARNGSQFTLNTATLTDGWHDVRVVAYNADSVRTQQEARISLRVNNAGHAITLTGPATVNPDASAAFTATLSNLGGLQSLRLQSNGRTIATFPTAGGTVNVDLAAAASYAPYAGDWVLYAVGTRPDGTQISSAPFTTTPELVANPATANPPLGGATADVRYFANTIAAGFNWDTAAPTAVATIPGDTTSGVSIGIDAIPNDADANTDPITLGGTTYTLTYANRPGFQVDFWFYAPRDDWYEFGHDFSERVFYSTRGQSERRECYVNGVAVLDLEGQMAPRRLAPGWHQVRMRFAVNAGSRFGANVATGPSPQGWFSWKARVRGGSNVDFQIIPPAQAANTGTGVAADVPTIASVTPTTTVTGTTRALTAAASIASGTLTYHWTRLSGGTHAGHHTWRSLSNFEPQTVNFSANGTTAASTSTITFYEPGSYVFGLRVAGPSGSAFTTVPLMVAATGQGSLFITSGSAPQAATGTIGITSGSPVVNMTSTSGLEVGQLVTGSGIPADTYIQSIVANTSITLTRSATGNGTALNYFPLARTLPGVPLPLVATSRDQFGFRIPVTPAIAGQPTVQWSSTDPGGSFTLLSPDGESARFVSSTLPTADQPITITATGVNGRTGSAITNITLVPVVPPASPASNLFTVSQPAFGRVSLNATLSNLQTTHQTFRFGVYDFHWSVLGTPSGQSLTLVGNGLEDITAFYSGPGLYTVRLDVSDQAGNSITETQSFHVGANGSVTALAFLSSPTNAVTFVGGSANFSSGAPFVPASTVTRQWQVSADNQTTWQNIPGATTTLLTVGPVAAADHGNWYRLVATTAAGTTVSSAAMLTVNNPSGGVIDIAEALTGGSPQTAPESIGTVTFTIQRRGQSIGAASIQWTLSASGATPGQDYLGQNGTGTYSGTVNWAAGELGDRVITVPIVDDAAAEGAEEFFMTLSGATGATAGQRTFLRRSIIDDDGPGTAQFISSAATVRESDGNAVLHVQRNFPYVGALSVSYATSGGTAIAGQDFTATAGTLTWTNGDTTSKQIVIPIATDAGVEGDETFTVALSASPSTLVAAPGSSTVTIKDAPYQQWQQTWWPSAIPAAPTFETYSTAIGVLAPLLQFRFSETAGTSTAGTDATGATVLTAPITTTGSGAFTLGGAGPRPPAQTGFDPTNTGLTTTAAGSSGTPPAYASGASANAGSAAALGTRLGLGFTCSAWVRTTDTGRIMSLLGGQNAVSVSLTGCAISSSGGGSTTITCASTAALRVGMTVTGTGIPARTTTNAGAIVTSIVDGTTFVISTVASGLGTTLTAADTTTLQITLNQSATSTTVVSPDHLRLQVRSSGNRLLSYSVRLASLPTGALTDGQWHHLVITVPRFVTLSTGDDNSDVPRFYFDGVEANLLDTRGTENINASDAFLDFVNGLRLGSAGAATPNTFFAGSVDEVAFFARVLNPTDVARLSNARPPAALPLPLSDNANPALDGIDNLTKYALGLNPLLPYPPGSLPWLGRSGTFSAFSFTRMRDATDITYRLERSPDLAPLSWQEIWNSAGDPYPGAAPSITETIARDEGLLDRVFYRLRITRP